MTKIAAKEWGQYGICVNVVLPGAESPAAKAWAEKFPEEYAKQVELNPMKRFGDSETDIAPVVAFLAGTGFLLLLRSERNCRRCKLHHAVTKMPDSPQKISPYKIFAIPKGRYDQSHIVLF